jgi:Trypsin-like peptidase domain
VFTPALTIISIGFRTPFLQTDELSKMLTVKLEKALLDIAGDGIFKFTDATQTLRFGRSMDCEIRLSPSDTRLGRNHFSLRPAAGTYELVTDREHPVFVGGERVIGTLPLTSETEVRLVDGKTGPSLSISISQDADGALTDAHYKTDSGTIQQGMKTLRRAVAAGAVLGLALGGFYFYQAHEQHLLQQAFNAETASLIEKFKTESQSPSVNWATLFAKLKGSVYQVAVMSNDGSAPQAQGTAWVYGAHSLATNAHVASLFRNLNPGQTLVVIAPDGQQKPIAITDAILHPAYLTFRDNIDATERSTNVKIKTQGSFDVGLLMVDSETQLAPPLQIASAKDLQSLQPGMVLAYIGYPAAFAKDQTAEQLRIGYVSGSADFLGVASGQSGELIYHTAPAVGGASGSPIFNDKGDVIAVHSGGETRDVAQNFINSGSGTFYAQNANLIAEITTGWPADKMSKSVALWQGSALYLAKRNQIWALLQSYREKGSLDSLDTPPSFKSNSQLIVGQDRSGSATASAEWRNAAPGTYVAFVSSGDEKTKGNFALRIKMGDTIIQSPLYLDASPTAIFKVDQPQDILFSMSGTAGDTAWLQVLKIADAVTVQ